MSIEYIKGDATAPVGNGNMIIAHVCNDLGGWGKGFVLSLSNRWRKPEEEYRNWHRSGIDFTLGEVQFVQIRDDLVVANMIAQKKMEPINKVPPIRYDALAKCLQMVAGKALKTGASVHMPRIGCGISGGKWEIVQKIVYETLVEKGVNVTVYDWVK